MDREDVTATELFPFDQLPPELQTLIFLSLDLPSLAAAMQVSPTWHAMIEEPIMWKLKCIREFPHYLEGAPLPEQDCIIPDEKNYKLTLEELEDAVSRGNEQALLRLIALIHRFTQIHADDDGSEETAEVDANAGDSEPHQATPPTSSERESEETTKADAKDEAQPEKESLATKRKGKKEEEEEELPRQEVKDWKQFYRQCLECPNLDGRWIGEYGSHGKELVHVAHRGYRVLATKITGDANVPAGKPTFRMTLTAKGDKGKGQMHLADTGYVRARWGRAYLEVVDKNNLVVKWFYGVHPSQHFDTYYERVKQSSESSEADEAMREGGEEEEEEEQGKEAREGGSGSRPRRPKEATTSADGGAGEGRERKRAKREVTESGFAFCLARSPNTGQMYVREMDEEGSGGGDSDQGEVEDLERGEARGRGIRRSGGAREESETDDGGEELDGYPSDEGLAATNDEANTNDDDDDVDVDSTEGSSMEEQEEEDEGVPASGADRRCSFQ